MLKFITLLDWLENFFCKHELVNVGFVNVDFTFITSITLFY